MEFEALEKKIALVGEDYAKKFDFELTPDWLMLKLQEEFGELAQAYLASTGRSRHTTEHDASAKTAVARELADVFAFTVLLARELGVDVKQAVRDKWFAYID